MADLDVRQQNIQTTSVQQTGAASAPANASKAVNVSVQTSSDSLQTGNTSNAKQKTLRGAGVVDQDLQNITNQTGLDKTKLLEIIQKMTGKSYEDLLDLAQNDYNKLTKGLLLIIKDCMVNGEIDSAKLEQATKDYHTATQTGWSLEGFRKQQMNVKKSSLSERLIATGCLTKAIDPKDPDYDAKMEAAIEKFFEKTLLSRIDKNTPAAKREQIYKAQLQTFGRLLVNTPEGREKELLGSAIDKLYRTNIVSAAQAGIDAMGSVEAKANFAKHIDYKEAVTTASEYEEDVYMTSSQAKELAHIKYSNMNADDINSDLPVMRQEAEKFFEENKEILAEIERKIENKEELTKEEQAILREKENLHLSRYVGVQTGVANSHNPTVEEQKENLLKLINNDIYEIGEKAGNDFYREVMTEVVNYIDEHPETLTMSKEAFSDLMDKVTGGNYSTVVSDIQNGTTSELTPPSQASSYVPASTSNSSSSTDFGFTVPEEPVNTVNPNQSKDRLYAQAAPVNETPVNPAPAAAAKAPQDIIAATQNTKTFSAFLKDNGAVTTVTEVFSNITHITNQGIINRATLLYKGLKQMQDDVLMAVNNSGLRVLLPHTSESTLKSLEGQTFANFDATRQVREACEEIEA